MAWNVSEFNSYYGEEVVVVGEHEYYQDPYISRCRIIHKRNNFMKAEADVILSRRDFDDAMRCKQNAYQMGLHSLSSSIIGVAMPPPQTTTHSKAYNYPTGTYKPVQEKPKENKPEKAPKQIRHQFLRRRLLDRIK